MAAIKGAPCWYELTTAPGRLAAAGAFYAGLLDWQVTDAGMEGFTYHLGSAGGDMIAGLMEPLPGMEGMPSFWMVYFATPDGDATAAAIRAAGGTIHRDLAEIPGTGRFAICADPQGAVFGLLEPLPMANGSPGGKAFSPPDAGHGCWHELMTPDQDAALAFYGTVFGWTKTRSMPMGEMGNYDIFAWDGTDIGGMMRQGNAPVPAWMPYFTTGPIGAAEARLKAGGATLIHGPAEVPGGGMIIIATDPMGAAFGVVGTRD